MPASAAEDPSYASCSPPAARGAVGARGSAPHAHDDLKDEVMYFGESDVSDSRNIPEASRSPAVPRHPSRSLSNERTREMHHSLFGSDDEFVVRITMPHQLQLVLLRTSVMTMVRTVVMLTAVVPTEVPRQSAKS